MSFSYLQFSPKTNEKIWRYYYGSSSRIVFVRFLEKLKTPKRHFEINWPLSKQYWWNHKLLNTCKRKITLVKSRINIILDTYVIKELFKHLGELNFRIIWFSKTIVSKVNTIVWQLRTDWPAISPNFDRSLYGLSPSS